MQKHTRDILEANRVYLRGRIEEALAARREGYRMFVASTNEALELQEQLAQVESDLAATDPLLQQADPKVLH